MTSRRTRSVALGISFVLAAAVPAASIYAQSEPAAQDTSAAAAEPAVEPEAVAALKRMSAYLMTLTTAQITSEGSLDVVTEDGQRVQMDAVTNYKLRRPGFVIDYSSDAKSRRFIYDGKQLTVYAPMLGFYGQVPAPATNREVLDLAYQKYGIKLPLEDLFRWNDPNSIRPEQLTSGYQLGTATLDGVETDHYVFREAAIDWEIWIQQGDQPLPRKVVIIDRTQSERPTFIARLQWQVNPPLTDADFAFAPGKDEKKIELATFEGE